MNLKLEQELATNQAAKFQNNQLQNEMIAWVGKRRWDVFVTLTFKHKVTPKVASKTLHHFFNHLSRKCKTKEIKRVPVLEHTANASHYHMTLSKPNNLTNADFQRLIRDCWTKLKGTGVSNLLLRNNGKESSWYEEIGNTKEDIENVIGYMTKTIGNGNETLDIMGVRL